jgi:DNA polymerase, archaea type
MGDKIEFFVLDLKYKIVNNKVEVSLFSRTMDGKSIVVIDDSFEPYFYVVSKKGVVLNDKLEKLKVEKEGEVSEVVKTENVKRNFLGKEVDAVKVFTKLPRDIPVIMNLIKEWEIIENINEYDIPFIRRYLVDKGIIPMTLLEAEVEEISRKAKVPVFRALSIGSKEDETLVNPQILAFDIETYNPDGKTIDFEKNPIIMLSFYGAGFKKVFTWKRFETNEDYVEFVESEADLIQKFKETVEKLNPDLLAGYYSDGFDLPYIHKRASKYKIKLDLGLDYSDLNVSKRKISKAKIAGIVHLDVLNVIKKMFSLSLKTNYYDLDSVSEEMINEKKLDVDLDGLAKAWDQGDKSLSEYCSYNLRDSKLVFLLAEKIMPNIIEMVKTVGLPLYEVTRMGFSQLVEWYLIKQAKAYNEICPNKPSYDVIRDRMLNNFKGGFVFEPKPGLYKEVVIFDFRSLYPTIISSHNISLGMFNCDCCKESVKHIPIEGEDYWFCEKRKGFLSIVIEGLIKRRMRIKEMMKSSKNDLLEARQNNLKVLANAFYGYFGFFNARWYSVECARSITALGRDYTQKVIAAAEKEGFNVVYSDTDSIFLSLEGKSKTDAKQFAESINPSLPGMMDLEYEGFYPVALFVSAKAGTSGAKKKYALLTSDNQLLIKGFETVRRNWSIIAKEVQEKVLNIVLKENNPDKALRYVRSVIEDLKECNVPLDKVTIRTQLKKEIESYASVGPHVAVAKRLRAKGFDIVVGMAIEFVVTEGKGNIGDRARLPNEIKNNKYDSDYYINNQVLPSVERIFEVLGYKKEDLILDKKQSNLSSFMG